MRTTFTTASLRLGMGNLRVSTAASMGLGVQFAGGDWMLFVWQMPMRWHLRFDVWALAPLSGCSNSFSDFHMSTSEPKLALGVQFLIPRRDKWPPLQNAAS